MSTATLCVDSKTDEGCRSFLELYIYKFKIVVVVVATRKPLGGLEFFGSDPAQRVIYQRENSRALR